MVELEIVENGEVVRREAVSRKAVVSPSDGQDFDPAVVQRLEYDHSGQTSSISSECGETENRRETDEEPAMTIEGVMTEDQLSQAKQLEEGQEITIVSDIHQGSVFVKRITIEQNTDIIHAYIDGEEKLAFPFQLQLQQPQ